MQFTWQDIIATSIAMLAVGYLCYRSWLIVVHKKTGGCGTSACSGCAPADRTTGAKIKPLVPLDQLQGIGEKNDHPDSTSAK